MSVPLSRKNRTRRRQANSTFEPLLSSFGVTASLVEVVGSAGSCDTTANLESSGHGELMTDVIELGMERLVEEQVRIYAASSQALMLFRRMPGLALPWLGLQRRRR